MTVSQRYPYMPRVVVALMSVLLVFVVSATLATAQDSEPVSTGPLTLEGTTGVVSPGDTIEVRGAGFAPGGQVDITIESDPILLKTIRAEAAGAFVTSITIPSGLSPGVHTLRATGPDPGGGLRVLSASVTVTGEGPLVSTGAELMPVAAIGLAAVLAGAGTLALRRRRA